MIWLNPVKYGEILYCLFPYDLVSREPAPEPHFVMVIGFKDIDGIPVKLKVVYGTSRKIDDVRDTELLVDKTTCKKFDETGLTKPTKFQFRNSIELEYTDKYFISQKDKTIPYCGKIDFHSEPMLFQRMILVTESLEKINKKKF